MDRLEPPPSTTTDNWPPESVDIKFNTDRILNAGSTQPYKYNRHKRLHSPEKRLGKSRLSPLYTGKWQWFGRHHHLLLLKRRPLVLMVGVALLNSPAINQWRVMEASYQPFFQQYKAPSLATLVWMCRTGDENPNEIKLDFKRSRRPWLAAVCGCRQWLSINWLFL